MPPVRGSFHWSGTKILIFTPQAPALPNATKYNVTIAASATSVAGRALAAQYAFTFTTPTTRVLSADWYRKTGRFDSPAVIVLRFNQRVRPEDVLAHVRLHLTAHSWGRPMLTIAARTRLGLSDPTGLRQFDEKVAAVTAVVSSSAPIGARLANQWNQKRFPPSPTQVVIETTTAAPPESWITAAFDDRLPSLEGRETHSAHSTVVRLERAFFIDTLVCQRECDPDTSHGLNTWRPTTSEKLNRALSVHDLTDPSAEKPVVPAADPKISLSNQPSSYFSPQAFGIPVQPASSTWPTASRHHSRPRTARCLGFRGPP